MTTNNSDDASVPTPPVTAAAKLPTDNLVVVPGGRGGSTVIDNPDELEYLNEEEQARFQSRKFVLTVFYSCLSTIIIFLYVYVPKSSLQHPQIHDILYNLRLMLTAYLGTQGTIDVLKATPDAINAWKGSP